MVFNKNTHPQDSKYTYLSCNIKKIWTLSIGEWKFKLKWLQKCSKRCVDATNYIVGSLKNIGNYTYFVFALSNLEYKELTS